MAHPETRKFIGQITANDGMAQKALSETLGKPGAVTPFLERVVPGLIDFYCKSGKTTYSLTHMDESKRSLSGS